MSGFAKTLITVLLVAVLSFTVYYNGFGKGIQDQTQDQSGQIAQMNNDPAAGSVEVPAIVKDANPADADKW